MFHKPVRIAAALTSLALLTAACSSGGTSGSASSSFTGHPVVIGQILPLTGPPGTATQVGEATKAAVDYYNAHGGLQGHKLVLDQCDSGGGAFAEAQCAQRLVADHAVAEIAGEAASNVGVVQPTLASAGIPRIGLLMGSLTEYTAKTNYAIDSGAIFLVAGMVVQLIRHGCTNPSVVTTDTSSAAQLPALLKPIAAQAGGSLGNLVLVPSTTSDFAPFVGMTTANGACGGALALSTAQATSYLDTYSSSNQTFKVALSSGSFSSADLKSLPASVVTKAYFTFGLPFADDPAAPGMANVERILSGGGSTLTLSSLQGQAAAAVLAMHAFMVVAGSISGGITGAAVNSAMVTATNIDMWGLVPPWSPGSFVKVGGPFGDLYSNISNPLLWNERWNGTHGTSSGTYNILSLVPGSGVSASAT